MDTEDLLSRAIRDYRARYDVSPEFSESLDRLEVHGFSLDRDPAASLQHVRWNAAGFIVHYIEFVLDDHRLSDREMQNVFVLSRIFNLDEGDLLALQRPAIAELICVEMERMLVDERVDDLEAMHQADLQRALGLGYDEYLRLARESIRPLVHRLLDEARGGSRQQQDKVIRRLQGLQSVLRIDPETMTAIWPD